eukprot:766595-Hanusia_phi.AAC.3
MGGWIQVSIDDPRAASGWRPGGNGGGGDQIQMYTRRWVVRGVGEGEWRGDDVQVRHFKFTSFVFYDNFKGRNFLLSACPSSTSNNTGNIQYKQYSVK